MSKKDVFVMAPLEIKGQRLEFSIPHSHPHSELLCAIAARQLVEEDAGKTFVDGSIVATFDLVRQSLQLDYLMGTPGAREAVLDTAEDYLAAHPDADVAGTIAFVRKNPPTAPEIMFGGGEARTQNRSARRRGRKG